MPIDLKPPDKIRKPLVFLYFQGRLKETGGMKQVN